MNAKKLVAALHTLHPDNEHMVPIAESWCDGMWTVDLAIQDKKNGLDIEATSEDPSLFYARRNALARLRRTHTIEAKKHGRQ